MLKRIVVFTFFIVSFSFSGFCQNWQGLGTGMNDAVRCFYVDTLSNTFYAGGNFSISDGTPTWGVAKWNGTGWDSLGGGMAEAGCCGPVFDIINYKGNIYAGGGLGEGITKWNGSSWVSVGGGVKSSSGGAGVFSLKIYNDELYVGGIFDSAGSISANGLAKWNDTIWSDVYSLPNYFSPGQNFIYCTTFFQGELYVGGNFTGTGKRLVKWDGISWQTVGGGFQGSIADVSDLAIYNNELYVSGAFHKSDGNPGDAIAKWDGSTWNDVGGGFTSINAQIVDLIVFDNELYAVGGFLLAGGAPITAIAKWDNSQWCGLGTVSANGFTQMGVYNTELYVGCDNILNGDTVNYIAKWIGGTYVDTCGTLTGVTDLANEIFQFEIYPNPSQLQITIEFYLAERKNVSVEIKNILGETIKTIPNNTFTKGNNKFEIDVSKLSKGFYFIQLQSEKSIITKKIIKE